MTFESPSGGSACSDLSQCPLKLRALLGTQAPGGLVSDGQVSEGLQDTKLTNAQTADLGGVGLEGLEVEPKEILDPFVLGKAVRDFINDIVEMLNSYYGAEYSQIDEIIIKIVSKVSELKWFLEINRSTDTVNPNCIEETLWFVNELLARPDVLKGHPLRLGDIMYSLERLLRVINDEIRDELRPDKFVYGTTQERTDPSIPDDIAVNVSTSPVSQNGGPSDVTGTGLEIVGGVHVVGEYPTFTQDELRVFKEKINKLLERIGLLEDDEMAKAPYWNILMDIDKEIIDVAKQKIQDPNFQDLAQTNKDKILFLINTYRLRYGLFLNKGQVSVIKSEFPNLIEFLKYMSYIIDNIQPSDI